VTSGSFVKRPGPARGRGRARDKVGAARGRGPGPRRAGQTRRAADRVPAPNSAARRRGEIRRQTAAPWAGDRPAGPLCARPRPPGRRPGCSRRAAGGEPPPRRVRTKAVDWRHLAGLRRAPVGARTGAVAGRGPACPGRAARKDREVEQGDRPVAGAARPPKSKERVTGRARNGCPVATGPPPPGGARGGDGRDRTVARAGPAATAQRPGPPRPAVSPGRGVGPPRAPAAASDRPADARR
jgi:hypothetical protein